MCKYCKQTTRKHCKKYTTRLELLDGLYFCDDCLGQIVGIELIA